MENMENVGFLVEEYRAEFDGIGIEDTESLAQALQEVGDWTPNASEQLVALARNYGAFMLRNALAVAIALEIEDGDLGF
ncbi:MAG TPA: hypothetical protein PKI11_00335 [Candidatus Hydrogenedentes bacterium]|nr:hypothetical protein [Candidatus Hydrogenedentota bacterium]HNT86955.1 hypothetical protein [Candidatus Hydrogenedentota bacterium]